MGPFRGNASGTNCVCHFGISILFMDTLCRGLRGGIKGGNSHKAYRTDSRDPVESGSRTFSPSGRRIKCRWLTAHQKVFDGSGILRRRFGYTKESGPDRHRALSSVDLLAWNREVVPLASPACAPGQSSLNVNRVLARISPGSGEVSMVSVLNVSPCGKCFCGIKKASRRYSRPARNFGIADMNQRFEL